MTNKTEDKFYFGKNGQPERFDANWGARESTKDRARSFRNALELDGINAYHEDGIVFIDEKNLQKVKQRQQSEPYFKNVRVKGIAKYDDNFSRPGQPERFEKEYVLWGLPKGKTDRLHEKVLSTKAKTPAQMDEIKRRAAKDGWHSFRVQILDLSKPYTGFSRPGQPERFMRDIPVKSWKKGAEDYEAGITEDSGRFQPYVNMPKSGTLVTRNAPTFKSEAGARKWLSEYLAKQGFSRPGQPERFDASSLDRKGFAEASSSPMLGKLLSEKQMPEGGWRAVETGGGALVISFEDADVAGNFARRVAGSGYSATAPVQAIGRYWNVEVKNG